LLKNIGEWAYIVNKETNQKVAKWKNSLTSPVSNYFELLDNSLEEYELLFLGIFHTYLYGE
ncbi:tubby C-terminal domain-like protein, partial [Staphylococcus xylosus]